MAKAISRVEIDAHKTPEERSRISKQNIKIGIGIFLLLAGVLPLFAGAEKDLGFFLFMLILGIVGIALIVWGINDKRLIHETIKYKLKKAKS